jgi:hypothetical protein
LPASVTSGWLLTGHDLDVTASIITIAIVRNHGWYQMPLHTRVLCLRCNDLRVLSAVLSKAMPASLKVLLLPFTLMKQVAQGSNSQQAYHTDKYVLLEQNLQPPLLLLH